MAIQLTPVLLAIVNILIISYALGLYIYAYLKGGKSKLIKKFVLVLSVCLAEALFIPFAYHYNFISKNYFLVTMLYLYSIFVFVCFIRQSFRGSE